MGDKTMTDKEKVKDEALLSETMRFIVITGLRIATVCTLYRLVSFTVLVLSMSDYRLGTMESVYLSIIDFVVVLGMLVATVVLFLVRTYDWIRPCELCIYELNKSRAFYDAVFIVLTIASGTPNSILLDIYMFVAVVIFVYDMIVNIMLKVAPVYCLKTFDCNFLRLHCYTFNNYFLCLCKNMSDSFIKHVSEMKGEKK